MFAGREHRTGNRLRRAIPSRAVLCLTFALAAGEAAAFEFAIPALSPGSADTIFAGLFVAMGAVTAVLLPAWLWMRGAHGRALDQVARLEARLDEAGAVLTAEPHLLYIWRGKEQLPSQVAGELRGMKDIPRDYAGRVDFTAWLHAEAAARLNACLGQLRAIGAAFNIIVKTAGGELLEADGRAAGGLATLRLRMLTGDRIDVARLAEDCRVLKHKAKALTAVLDRLPMPIWIREDDGRMKWVNAAFVESVEAEDAGSAISAGHDLMDPELADRALESVARGDVSTQRAHAVVGGERRVLDIVSVPLASGSAGFARDVTELEDARGELAQHIQAHTSTLDRLATAVAIFGADQRLRFFNAAYAGLWQLDAQWLAEKPSDGEILDRLRSDRRLPEQADFRAWKARRMDVYTNLEAREDWWHLPDGRSLRVVTEQHPFGGVTYLYEDVTERLNLESRYNALIGVQRETLDNLHEGVALFGSDGRLKLFNPAYAKIWNLDPDRLEAEPHFDNVADDCRAQFDDDDAWNELKISVTSLEEMRRPLRARLNRPDGSVIDFSGVPLPDGATLLTYVDITDSSRIERALRERNNALETADRLKTEFISHVSYELRTPLTNIIGFTESLTLGLAGGLSPRQNEYAGHILSSSQTLLASIDDILDLATIDAGVMELDLSDVDVAETLKAAAQLVSDRVRARGLILEITIPEDVSTFKADERRIKQILYNLLSNAVGFSARGSAIGMGARLDRDLVCFWVSDNGPGIEPEHQSAVFDRFETRTGGSEHRGAGLGLSVVKSFVELHEGAVSLISEPAEGTMIECRFPLSGPSDGPKADTQQHEARLAPAESGDPAGTGRAAGASGA